MLCRLLSHVSGLVEKLPLRSKTQKNNNYWKEAILLDEGFKKRLVQVIASEMCMNRLIAPVISVTNKLHMHASWPNNLEQIAGAAQSDVSRFRFLQLYMSS